MNPNWLGTVGAGGALAAFLLTYRVAMHLPRRTRALATLGSLPLAIPGASFAAYYGHCLPEASWYYEFRSLPGTECLLILLGVPGGLVASLLPRTLLIAPLFGVAAFALAPILKPFVRPIPYGTVNDRWDGDICLQSTPSTCGAASVATILRSCGVVATERQLAREAHSYVGGTEVWYLARAVRSRGCEARFYLSSGFDPDIPFPALVGVRLGTDGHFIAILSREGDLFRVGDPLQGHEVLSRGTLLERYEFTGFYVAIARGCQNGAAAANHPTIRNSEPSPAPPNRAQIPP